MERSKVSSCHVYSYGSDDVKLYAERSVKLKDAFFSPTIGKFLQMEAPGKRVLDIGCGTGDWCYQAALCDAKSIDGFDKQEKMVELARQTTSQFSTVNIQLGDIMSMPYDDNTFDIALSIYVTCELPIDALSKHFKELHRVLVPGGKALVLNYSNPGFQTMYLTNGVNEEVVQKKIDQELGCISDHLSQQQISKAFEDLHEVVMVCFAYDSNGSLFQVKNVNQLVNGQPLLHKTNITIFPGFYYDDQFLVDQTITAGLHIENIENVYTEERRIIHNTLNPESAYSKMMVDHPHVLLYHLSKPVCVRS